MTPPIVCKCGSLHIIRVNKYLYKCIKCNKIYKIGDKLKREKEVCPYCKKSVHILNGPSTYIYDWETKQVVHRKCYNERGV